LRWKDYLDKGNTHRQETMTHDANEIMRRFLSRLGHCLAMSRNDV